MPTPTINELRKALQISEQIEALKANLASFFGGVVDVPARVLAGSSVKAKRKGKRTMSPETKAKMAAAQQKRWAKSKGSESVAPAAPMKAARVAKSKKKGGISAEGRARIVAAQKLRWAKVKGQKSTPISPKATPSAKKKKRLLRPEARARIVAAVKARWARTKKGK